MPRCVQVHAHSSDGPVCIVAPWAQQEDFEEHNSMWEHHRDAHGEVVFTDYLGEHGGIQGTLFGPEQCVVLSYFYIAAVARSVAFEEQNPHYGIRVFRALQQEGPLRGYCVILQALEKAGPYWINIHKFKSLFGTDGSEWLCLRAVTGVPDEVQLGAICGSTGASRIPIWVNQEKQHQLPSPEFGSPNQPLAAEAKAGTVPDQKEHTAPPPVKKKRRKDATCWYTMIQNGDPLDPRRIQTCQDLQTVLLGVAIPGAPCHQAMPEALKPRVLPHQRHRSRTNKHESMLIQCVCLHCLGHVPWPQYSTLHSMHWLRNTYQLLHCLHTVYFVLSYPAYVRANL
jgi:hypothetical protein